MNINLDFLFYNNKISEFKDDYDFSFFLAGPSIKGKSITFWREEAFKIFKEYFTYNCYDIQNISVCINSPEFSPFEDNKNFNPSYEEIIDWELFHLNKSTKIFWIPRSNEYPGFTTNIEFGMFYKNEETFYGRPNDAIKVKYLDYIWTKNRVDNREIKTNLKDLILYTLENTLK